jgi:enoyl-CoA hydratase/carnithine racemase
MGLSVSESATESTSEVLVEWPHDGVAVVRLNRPEARNALSMPLRHRLAEIFVELKDDDSVRAVVLTGSDSVFAAGADVRSMVNVGAVEMYHRHNERLWGAIGDYPRPVIAAVNGYALGGGLELAMHADIIIAGQSAQLGQPEVKLGIMPGAGGTQRLIRAVGKFQALRLCLSGEAISADEALTWGLVSQVVPDEDVIADAIDLACRLAAMPTIAVEQIKEVLVLGEDAPLSTALALERKALQLLFASEDKEEGMAAFVERRHPSFRGL